MMARLLRVTVLALAIAAAQGLRIGVTGAHGFLGNEVCWLACSQVLFSPPVFSCACVGVGGWSLHLSVCACLCENVRICGECAYTHHTRTHAHTHTHIHTHRQCLPTYTRTHARTHARAHTRTPPNHEDGLA